jgi:chromosome segregation ATPase
MSRRNINLPGLDSSSSIPINAIQGVGRVAQGLSNFQILFLVVTTVAFGGSFVANVWTAVYSSNTRSEVRGVMNIDYNDLNLRIKKFENEIALLQNYSKSLENKISNYSNAIADSQSQTQELQQQLNSLLQTTQALFPTLVSLEQYNRLKANVTELESLLTAVRAALDQLLSLSANWNTTNPSVTNNIYNTYPTFTTNNIFMDSGMEARINETLASIRQDIFKILLRLDQQSVYISYLNETDRNLQQMIDNINTNDLSLEARLELAEGIIQILVNMTERIRQDLQEAISSQNQGYFEMLQTIVSDYIRNDTSLANEINVIRGLLIVQSSYIDYLERNRLILIDYNITRLREDMKDFNATLTLILNSNSGNPNFQPQDFVTQAQFQDLLNQFQNISIEFRALIQFKFDQAMNQTMEITSAIITEYRQLDVNTNGRITTVEATVNLFAVAIDLLNATTRSQQVQIDLLRSDLTNVQSALTNFQNAVTAQNSLFNAAIANLQSLYNSLQTAVTALTGQMSVIQDRIVSLEANATGQQVQLNSLIAQYLGITPTVTNNFVTYTSGGVISGGSIVTLVTGGTQVFDPRVNATTAISCGWATTTGGAPFPSGIVRVISKGVGTYRVQSSQGNADNSRIVNCVYAWSVVTV